MLDVRKLLQLTVNYYLIKDIHRKNAPQNKTQTLKKI